MPLRNLSIFLTSCDKKKRKFFLGCGLGDECIGVLKNKLHKFHDLFDLVLIIVANTGSIAPVKIQTLIIEVYIDAIQMLRNNFEFKWMNLPFYSGGCSGIGLLDDFLLQKKTEKW